MRCRLAAGVALGWAGLMTLGMLPAAEANYGPPEPGGCSAPQQQECGPMGRSDVAADCEQAAMDTPRGPGGLRISTDVPDGAQVAPGQDILVTLTWDPRVWSGPELDAALACVRVKGGLDPELSRSERPAANDGRFEYVLHVPGNIRPGCDICVQGFVTGMPADGGPGQATSETPCFMSGPPGPPTPPATRPPAPPAGPTTTTTAPRIPTEVGGVQTGQPAAPLSPAPAPSGPEVAPGGELPRTGSPVTQLVAASGGLALTFGGLSVMGGAGRGRVRRRR